MQFDERDRTNAVIHLYRGELSRMTTYRVRLDTTTNWAVGTTAAIATFALSASEMPHYVFGLPVTLNLIFLWMEARRFRGYELIRQRVRLLERGFYGQVLNQSQDPDWRERLAQSLRSPSMPIGLLQAFSVRMRRTYLWLLAVVYLGWVVKLDLQASASGLSLVDAAGLGKLPGSIVISVVVASIIPLLWLSSIHRPREEG
jgi:uncharacterized membrane protein